MVSSASSSNTQWPSACWSPRNASLADAMLFSSALAAIAVALSVDCICIDTHKNLVHGEDEIRGAVSRSHRSLDGRRQAGISPVAREEKIFERRRGLRPQRILFRRRLKCG